MSVDAALVGAPVRRPAAWRRVFRRTSARVGLLITAIFLLLTVLAPVVAPYDPYEQDLSSALSPPSAEHRLGADQYGRDMLSRVLYGTRTALLAVVVADGLALVTGCTLGLIAGFFGGIAETVIMRIVDVLLAFPYLLLALIIVAALGPGLTNSMIAIGIVYTPQYARLIRGQVLAVRQADYVRAARALGASPLRQLLRHVLPNSFPPILVMATLQAGSVVVETAGLSFLGLGAQPPSPDWGALLADGQSYFLTAWWIATFPGLAIFILVLGFNLLGDALRDHFDPAARLMTEPLLDIRDLSVEFLGDAGTVSAVAGVSFSVARGETIVIVGESGSGKSVTSLAIMGLIPQPPGRIAGGEILFRARDGRVHDLVREGARGMQKLRGAEIAMIFQEPMSALNPVYTIGEQIVETLRLHEPLSERVARLRAIEMLGWLGVPDPARRFGAYPHELSGGLRQRAMIAMALSCRPSLLIADEPTTALDVTVQAQILELIRKLQRELSMGVIFITHNLGVAAEIADRILVMYAGQNVEAAPTRELFEKPRMPYTRGLLDSIPRLGMDRSSGPLPTIPGSVPRLSDKPAGCTFHPRCAHMRPSPCVDRRPELEQVSQDHAVRCARWRELDLA